MILRRANLGLSVQQLGRDERLSRIVNVDASTQQDLGGLDLNWRKRTAGSISMSFSMHSLEFFTIVHVRSESCLLPRNLVQ